VLELGFFGGEPLLEAGLVARLADYASSRAAREGKRVTCSITTNGTVTTPDAGAIMRRAGLDLAVSFDGLPEIHDRHRRFADGRGSSGAVLATMRRLLNEGSEFGAVMVVRPDTVEALADGLAFLRGLGVRRVEPALDLWAEWTAADAARLARAIERAARVWAEGLPRLGVGWFDEKAAQLAGIDPGATARCGFGDGEIAVAPSGSLYPCERLIGEDGPGNPMRLPGHVFEGDDFLGFRHPPARRADACSECRASSLCNTTCRCSNYVRTGDVSKPDGLLCLLNEACLRETAKALAASPYQIGLAAG
jgi:uncharacterized protein